MADAIVDLFTGGSRKATNAMAGAADASAQATLAATRETNQMLRDFNVQGRQDLAPWRTTGGMALDLYSGLLGLPSIYDTPIPTVPGTTLKATDFPASSTQPGVDYEWRYDYNPESGKYEYRQYPVNGTAVSTEKTPGTGEIGQVTPEQAAAETARQNAMLSQYQQAMSGPSTRYNPTEYIKRTPGYEFQFNEGLRALDRSAASRGMLGSGATGRALQEYGQNYALGQYNNLMNQLANLAGVGQTASAQTGQMGANTANQIAGTTMAGNQAYNAARMQGAEATASGYLNRNQMWGNTIGQLLKLTGFGGGMAGW